MPAAENANESKPLNKNNQQSDVIDYNTNSSVTNTSSNNYYMYMVGFLIIAVIIYLLWTSYSCFYDNQDLFDDPFISGTIKSSPDDDIVFDVDGEINKLRELQENYLNNLKSENF